MKTKNIILLLVASVIIGFWFGWILTQDRGLGGVSVGNEYTATTTPSGVGEWTDQTLDVGWGSLGSVVITKAGDVEFTLYDATSTGAVTNDTSFNKSLKQLGRIPENLAAGTYVFDVTYNDGLVLDVERGTTGTSTISFR